jgi:hypothetical protein
LKDASKRREYDLIYPSIKQSHPSSQTFQTPRPASSTTSQSEALHEAAQIAALHKSKHERSVRWQTKKATFDASILEMQKHIRELEQAIKNLKSIAAAEAAAEAYKKSWGAWLLSPIYKQAEDTEEQKARKDREKQERRIEKDMKERRLMLKKEGLSQEQSRLRKAKEEADAAILIDENKIRIIKVMQMAREARERQERDRVERERIEQILKQQQEQWEKQQREAAETLRKRQAEQRAAEERRQAALLAAQQALRQEQARKLQEELKRSERQWKQHVHYDYSEYKIPPVPEISCDHDGWWPKVQGRTACPTCSEVWTYLLECPGCTMKACPRCQSAIRPRFRRGAARLNRGSARRARSPSPDYWD